MAKDKQLAVSTYQVFAEKLSAAQQVERPFTVGQGRHRAATQSTACLWGVERT